MKSTKSLQYNYHEVITKLRQELNIVPANIIDLAYDFRDFLEKHFPEQDYEYTFETVAGFNLTGDPYYGEETLVTYKIIVKVNTYSVYHNDSATDSTIHIHLSNEFLFNGSNQIIPWNKNDKRAR